MMVPQGRRAYWEKFQHHKPPTFSGTESTIPPQEAENWVSRIEKILDVSKTDFSFWAVFGAAMFSGEARGWWSSIKHKIDVDVLSWAQFVDLFNRRFIEKGYRYAKLREFIKLAQGEMSVAEYEAKFRALSRYCAQLVGDRQMRADKFQDGLNVEIRSKVVPLKCTTFGEVVRAALLFEQEINVGFQDQITSEMKYTDTDTKVKHTGSGGKNRKVRKNNGVKNSPYGIKKYTIEDRKCFICQQYGHIRNACPNNRKCYNCRQFGHVGASCPQIPSHRTL